MGGIGSGGSRKTPSYQLVERFSRVDINRLRRFGFIPKGAGEITFHDAILPVVWRKQVGCTTGDRAFFQCPRCSRSVWKLYRNHDSDTWGCRDCKRLAYRSSMESKDRLARSACRAYKIRVRLGSPDTFHLAAIPDKPKKMRWKTYDRLLARLFEEHKRSNLALMARLKQITGADLKPLA